MSFPLSLSIQAKINISCHSYESGLRLNADPDPTRSATTFNKKHLPGNCAGNNRPNSRFRIKMKLEFPDPDPQLCI